MKLLEPYLPQHGQSGSQFQEGGALYAYVIFFPALFSHLPPVAFGPAQTLCFVAFAMKMTDSLRFRLLPAASLGLIHVNHGGEKADYLLDCLRNAGNNEVVQHGACLGLGLSAMATNRQDIFEDVLLKVRRRIPFFALSFFSPSSSRLTLFLRFFCPCIVQNVVF